MTAIDTMVTSHPGGWSFPSAAVGIVNMTTSTALKAAV